MPSPPDNVVGSVELSRSTSIMFTIQSWKGRLLAHARKFVATGKYEGPTKAGMAMAGDVLLGLIESLEKLQAEAPGVEGKEFARVSKRGEVDIVISTVSPDDLKSLPSVDVREFVDTPDYTGPTKKGIRFPWDKLGEVIAIMRTQAQRIGAKEKSEPTLFPQAKPKWVEQAADAENAPPAGRDTVIAELLPNGPKRFPDDFVDGTATASTVLQLPPEPIDVTIQQGGKQIVRSHFGFCHAVRNAVEGNFILYAHLRGHRTVHVPRDMPVLFRAVTTYKNYLRELQRSLIQAYERKSGHRPMAEHQTKEAFHRFGLPWIAD